MLERIQRFGGALFTPVLFFGFSGIILGITIVLMNPNIVGDFANPEGLPYKLLYIMQDAAWAVFRHMPMLFALGIPVGLAKTAKARACLASFTVFLFFNYYINSILTFWGPQFGVDFSQPVGAMSGLTEIAGIKTLDMSVFGGILIGSLVAWIHNRFFEYKLPDFIGIFQGAVMVVMIGYFAVLPLAFASAWLWPKVQGGIASLQTMMASSGALGVWMYTFLERILIPTGLHHFIYTPFMYGPAVVDGGIVTNWAQNIVEISNATAPLKEVFPAGGFALHGNSKVFGAIGIALAMYFTADDSRKKAAAGLLIPATLTAVSVGVTEPLEFTFLFIAPVLFAVHAILAATMATVMYMFGVVGNMGGGLIDMFTMNWLPLFDNHAGVIATQIIVGMVFTGIYFLVFRTLILKLDIKTPGREAAGEVKLYSKKDYKEKKAGEAPEPEYAFLEALGGTDNIKELNNCATRLRISVYDAERVASDDYFKSIGAHGVVRNGTAIQVVVGLSVARVREGMEKIINSERSEKNSQQDYVTA